MWLRIEEAGETSLVAYAPGGATGNKNTEYFCDLLITFSLYEMSDMASFLIKNHDFVCSCEL